MFYKTQLHPFGVLLVHLLHQRKHPKDKMETLQQCLTKALQMNNLSTYMHHHKKKRHHKQSTELIPLMYCFIAYQLI